MNEPNQESQKKLDHLTAERERLIEVLRKIADGHETPAALAQEALSSVDNSGSSMP